MPGLWPLSVVKPETAPDGLEWMDERDPEPWPEPVAGLALLNEMREINELWLSQQLRPMM